LIMGPEMTKLAAVLKDKCPYCGVRHAGKHNETTKAAARALEVLPAAALAAGILGGVPALSAATAAHNAPEGEGLSDALLTGGGSAVGGLAGALGGSTLGTHLGRLISPPSSGIRQGQKGFRFGGGWAGGALGGLAGLGLGQLGGALAGHATNRALHNKDQQEKKADFEDEHGAGGPMPPRKPKQPTGPKMQQLSKTLKTAGFGQMLGRGMGMAGKALGVLPTGVGNVAGAALGAVGGALTAPPGHRLAGAAAGSLSGLPGAAGFIAPAAAGKIMGV
jgi:hypothetical protein